LYKSFENDDDKEQVLKGSSLLKTYIHIPWESIVFCSMKLDLKTFEKTEYLITNPTWLNYLNVLFHKFPITIWKTFDQCYGSSDIPSWLLCALAYAPASNLHIIAKYVILPLTW
jgi:hypothetical protein